MDTEMEVRVEGVGGGDGANAISETNATNETVGAEGACGEGIGRGVVGRKMGFLAGSSGGLRVCCAETGWSRGYPRTTLEQPSEAPQTSLGGPSNSPRRPLGQPSDDRRATVCLPTRAVA